MKGDELFEKGAEKLQELSRKAAEQGGVYAQLAEPLGEDAAFVRNLKPSLVMARIRGQPTATASADVRTPQAPSGPQLGPRSGDGPSPFVVVGVAFVAGIVLAKVIDWIGYAHPRD